MHRKSKWNKQMVQFGFGLENKLRFEVKSKKNVYCQKHIFYEINPLKMGLFWFIMTYMMQGSVIFPHQCDSHRVSMCVCALVPSSSLVTSSVCLCLCMVFFSNANPGNAFQLVFKVSLNTPLNSTVQSSN